MSTSCTESARWQSRLARLRSSPADRHDRRQATPTSRLDSHRMEQRDRLANLGFFAAAAVVWLLVGLVVTTRDPVLEPEAGFIGAALIGLAIGLTVIPIFWLIVFGRHRRIAYRGDWTRAVRRGAWVGVARHGPRRAPHPGPARVADRAVHDRARRRRRIDAVRGTLTHSDRGAATA